MACMARAMQKALLLCGTAWATTAPPPQVAVPDLGTLTGRWSNFSYEVAVFNGIPYARPPVGDLRWRPPQPYGPWASPRNASEFGPACFAWAYQRAGVTESEDCLFLNVATPATSLGGAAKLPVMVFIHGGAYTSGSSSYNHPDVFVARVNCSVVLVTLNYRLNAFGFLGTQALRARSPDGSVGNYGLQDQRLALAWVRERVAAFGGDGDDVTIFGESAGGNSVIMHLTQTASFGLYSKAIIDSGAYDPAEKMEVAEGNYTVLLERAGCRDLACMLQLSGEDLSRAVRKGPNSWAPVIDSVMLTASTQELLSRGQFNKHVPVLIGSNRDEYAFFAEWLIPANLTEQQLAARGRKYFSAFGESGVEELMQLYRPSSYHYPADLGGFTQAWWTLMRMLTDGSKKPLHTLGHCTVRRTARKLLRGGTPAVYVYLFAHPTQKVVREINAGGPLPAVGPGNPVVPHATELPYFFDPDSWLSFEAGERDLASAMSRYWARFAATGDPNQEGLPGWPHYDAEDDQVLRLDTAPHGIHPQRMLRNAACNFWDGHVDEQSRSEVFV